MRRWLARVGALSLAALLASSCVLLDAGDRERWYQRVKLNFEPVWAWGQDDTLEGVGSFWLTVRGEGWLEEYEMAWEEGATRVVAEDVIVPDVPVSFLLQGYAGLGKADDFLLLQGSTAPKVVQGGTRYRVPLYLATAGQMDVFSAPPSFGAAVASDGVGTFYLFGGTPWGADETSDAQARDQVMAWSLSDPAENLALTSIVRLSGDEWDSADPDGAGLMQVSATLLEHGDHGAVGTILVAGGWESFWRGTTVRGEIRLFDPTDHVFTDAGALIEPRAGHVALELASGRVLIAGGWASAQDGELVCARTVEVWDPVVREVVAVSEELDHCLVDGAGASMGDAVVWCGGIRVEKDGYGAEGGCWLLGDDAGVTAISSPVSEGRGLLLPAMASVDAQRVLLSGGAFVDGTVPRWGTGGQWVAAQDGAWLYDSVWGGWKATEGGLQTARLGHASVALTGGGVLVTGGAQLATNYGVNVLEPSKCVELWALPDNSWEQLQPCAGDDGALPSAVHRASVGVDPVYGALVLGGLDMRQSAPGMGLYLPSP